MASPYFSRIPIASLRSKITLAKMKYILDEVCGAGGEFWFIYNIFFVNIDIFIYYRK